MLDPLTRGCFSLRSRSSMKRQLSTAKEAAARYLPDLDPVQVVRAAKFLLGHVSPIDYGWRNKDGSHSRVSDAELQSHFNKQKFVHALSQRSIVEHFAGKHTYCYTTRANTQYLLACLDLDWKSNHKAEHGDANDCLACAKFLQHELVLEDNQVYLEPSTGGDGIHFYMLLYVGEQSASDTQRVCAKLSSELSMRAKSEGFRCSVDGLKGTPSCKGTRGEMVKLPRLDSAEKLSRFLSLNVCPFPSLPPVNTRTDCGLTPPSVPYEPETLEQTTELQSGNHPPVNTRTDCGLTAEDARLNHSDPRVRMQHCGFELARRLGRGITAQELLQEYEALGLNTGEDVKNRRVKRAKEIAQYISQTFNPLRLGPEFNKDKAIEVLKTAEKPEGINLEKAADQLVYFSGMVTLKNDNPERNGTVSSVQARKKLKVGKEHYLAVKDWLAELKLIVPNGNGYRVGGPKNGISKKYKLGENHPLNKGEQI
jgi:hypothetical protein